MMSELLPALYYLFWVCAPIIPAILIYALFPKNPIGVRGPLGHLTVSASGAFAAYVIVFALAFPIVNKEIDVVEGLLKPVWQVRANVELVSETGSAVDPALLRGIEVHLSPEFYTTASGLVTVYMHKQDNRFPNINFTVPGFGNQAIDMSNESNLNVDSLDKQVTVKDTVKITRFPVIEHGAVGAPN